MDDILTQEGAMRMHVRAERHESKMEYAQEIAMRMLASGRDIPYISKVLDLKEKQIEEWLDA